MKHEAEQQLLKTLNGQLSELPSVAKIMIRQYQFYCSPDKQSREYKKKDPYGDYDGILMLGTFVGIPLEISLLVATSINIVHACAPIASLVSSILSN